MDLSNTSAPESFTIYRNFIHFRQPVRPPPVRSEQLRPCRQKPKTQRVRRPARSGGGRAQGEPRCKPERGSRKCAWAMWRCRRRTQEAEAKALRRELSAFLQKGLAKKLQSAAARTSIAHGKKSRGKPYHPAESRQVSATMGCFCTPCVAGTRSSFGRKAGNKSAPAAPPVPAADARRASRGANRNAAAGSVRGQCGAAAGGRRRRRQKRCGAGRRPFYKMAWRKNFHPAAAGKGSRHTGSSIGSAQRTHADCLFW